MVQVYRDLANAIAECPKADQAPWRSAYSSLPPASDSLSLGYRHLIEILLCLPLKPFEPPHTQAGAPLLSNTNPRHAVCHMGSARELAHLYQRLNLPLTQKAASYLNQLKAFPAFWLPEGDVLPALDISTDAIAPPNDPELGLSLHQSGPFSFALTTTGWKTGLGSIKKGETQILTFGPSTWPSRHFGIHLSPIEIAKAGEPIPGVHIARQGPIYHYAGWTRTIAQNHHLWSELSLYAHEHLDLDIRFLDLKGCQLSILMAVRAENLHVGNTFIESNSLKKYVGDAKTVTFQDMTLIPKQQGAMEVIPLAGDTSYWGADYLLVYTVSQPHLGWTIY